MAVPAHPHGARGLAGSAAFGFQNRRFPATSGPRSLHSCVSVPMGNKAALNLPGALCCALCPPPSSGSSDPLALASSLPGAPAFLPNTSARCTAASTGVRLGSRTLHQVQSGANAELQRKVFGGETSICDRGSPLALPLAWPAVFLPADLCPGQQGFPLMQFHVFASLPK